MAARQNIETDAPPIKRKRGRPVGRRTNDAYMQTSVFIKKDVHSAVMMHIAEARYLKIGHVIDFSELVDTLLAEWLEKNKKR